MVTIKDGNKTIFFHRMPETWNPENDFYETEENNEFKEFKQMMLTYWDNNLNSVFTKKRDLQIADAILELFREVNI